MAAGLFGALGAIGDTGNQVAEGNQLAHEEIARRLAEQQAQQTTTLNQQRIKQQIAQGAQNMQLAKQPVALGTPYVSKGKTYQRFQDPFSGKVTEQELPGGTAETDQEKAYRGLTAIGTSPEDAAQAVVAKYQGKESTITVNQPGADSPTGAWIIVKDKYSGQELWRTPGSPSRTTLPVATDTDSRDPITGLWTHRHSVRQPLLPGTGVPLGGATGRYGAPQTPLAAVRGAVGLPAAAASQGGAPAPQGGPVSRPIATPGNPANPLSPPATQGATSIGPYKGIQFAPDGTAALPPRAGITDSMRALAENLINGGDANKIPARYRGLVESIAKNVYGWKGQGSLTPAQQMQIEQVDNSLSTLSQDKFLKLFDSTATRLWMATVPLDPPSQGGAAGLTAALHRGMVPQAGAEYLNALTRLRGVITGIRSFTGANNSNATADRLLAELPNFTNTKNAADARNKLEKLRQEIAIIKKLGFYLPDSQSPVARDLDGTDKDDGSKSAAAPAPPAAAAHDDEATRILEQAGVIPKSGKVP
jgi:hypothetical protein